MDKPVTKKTVPCSSGRPEVKKISRRKVLKSLVLAPVQLSLFLSAIKAQGNVRGNLRGNNLSGNFYPSLGVHEHWSNPADKQYSKNLGTGEGIELVKIFPHG